MSDKWGWWSGDAPDMFSVGPLPTKEDAVQEAIDTGAFQEVETREGWRRLVFYAECRGLHYDCGECGVVPEACDGCKDALDPEDLAGTFAQTRNEGSVFVDYDDEEGGAL